MKKVVLTVAIILGGFSTYAVSTIPPTPQVELIAQEEYKEIKVEALPQAVKDALAKDFPTATLTKAYVGEKQELEYKLDLTIEGEELSVYADKDGNWVEKK
ncbi:hypothetical protein [Gelidibacter maritimus]|uniref:Beta-lactamase-inhibitor-like PepSY-like domain-containing protein n=1 Tax=Gelidibacter maritimus TaxID=2761487 RepID=A0A7W2M3J0_9FLAO|nr:hypothetical protein [Gelidibacter maritimus]MBA6152064.1 hypothetical protein [Gelidibacter maritimus]